MADRITFKMIKAWLAESEFAQEHGHHIQQDLCGSRIYDGNGNTVVSAETTGQLWQMYSAYKYGYFKRVEEERKGK